MSLGPIEALVIVGILVLVAGPVVMPRILRNLGRNVGAFREGMKDDGIRRELRDVQLLVEREDDPPAVPVRRTAPPEREPPETPAR